MSSAGYNPMRWKCGALGCFNQVARPKIEMFARCFPRNIAMGDMDGYVEINGRFLIMEWKNHPLDVEAQLRAFDSWVAFPYRMNTILCIAGNAQTMQVTHAMHYTGRHSTWRERDLAWCELFMTRWASWADRERRIYAAGKGPHDRRQQGCESFGSGRLV